MDFQFEIAGQIINEDPQDLTEWTEQAIFDRARATILIDYPSELTFTGDGYAYIKSLYDTLGFNTKVDVIIRKRDSDVSPWRELHRGEIPLSSCEFDFTRATVSLRITDETYNSKIRINSSTGVYAIDPKSKNKEDISAYLPTDIVLSLHDQDTGTYTIGYVAYDLLEVLDHCARWMTDGTIGVVSNFYDGLSTATGAPNDLHKIAIITGEEIKQKTSGIPPIISWDVLTEFTFRALGLIATVEKNTSGETQIRFEPAEETEGAAVVTLDKIPQINRSVNLSLIYANVKVGSRYFIKDEGGDDKFPLPLVPGMTHGSEEMYIEGSGNTGATLDLTTEICYDTNAIYDLYENVDHEDFDDRIFAIEYEDNGGTNRSVQDQWFSSKYLYNRNLITGEIVSRHRWHGNVITQYGSDADEFTAILTDGTYQANNLTATSGTVNIEPFKFDNDYAGSIIEGFNGDTVVEDTNNNWGNGTLSGTPVTAANSRYTCPSAGFYYFAGLVLMDLSRSQTEQVTLTVTVGFKRYNSGGALQETKAGDPQVFTFETDSSGSVVPMRISMNDITFAKQNDYIQFYVSVAYRYAPIAIIGAPYDVVSFTALDTSGFVDQWTFFQCLATENGGGIVASGGLSDYPAELDEFEIPMTSEQWETIKETLTGGINYNGQGIGNELGWIESIEHNERTARATVRLRHKFEQK